MVILNYIKQLFKPIQVSTIKLDRDTSNIKKLEEITLRLELVAEREEVLHNRRKEDK